MSLRAWLYVGAVLTAGIVLSVWTLLTGSPPSDQFVTFAVLTLLATLAQCYKAEAPSHQLYYTTRVFQFAAVFVLEPYYFVLLNIIAHGVEWAKERLRQSPHLRAWYVQPFNISMHILASFFVYRWVSYLSRAEVPPSAENAMAELSVLSAAILYLTFNHTILALALVLARGATIRESGVLDIENLLTDFVLLLMGYTVALLWEFDPWLLIPALAPLVLIYRALSIPQLKQEASYDVKTGLLNARAFMVAYGEALDRARQTKRPLAVVMADLDLLRNINNTYGHLAGDSVLEGIGRIIKRSLRDEDIAGRFGGEEFSIVLPDVERAEAMLVAERIRSAVEAATFDFDSHPTSIKATMSLGIACFPEDAQEMNTLIHEADVAVYQAKLMGRNRVVSSLDVPHSFTLRQAAIEGRAQADTAPVPAFTPRPGSLASRSDHPAPAGTSQAKVGHDAPPARREAPYASLTWIYVSGVVAAALAVSLLAVLRGDTFDLFPIVLFGGLALVAEFLQLDLYEKGSVSVSMVCIFSAALVAGLPGAIVASSSIAIVHQFRRRPALYKTAFNWATHVLSAFAPIYIIGQVGIPITIPALPILFVPAVVAALGHFIIETVLIAGAISLTEGQPFIPLWRTQFGWLTGHWIVMGILGLFLAAVFLHHGMVGVVVLLLPLVMMRYAQKQVIDSTEAGVRELRRMNEELNKANRQIVDASGAIQVLNDDLFMTLANVIDARDPYVSGHAEKVADYAVAIGQELNLPPARLAQLRQAGFLHDIGKLGIPERILHKPGRLTGEEYALIKQHASLGGELLMSSTALHHLAPFIRHHHEHWDGEGYPAGLAGKAIPLEARILALCDAVEAMASDRPYQKGKSSEEILAEVSRCRGTQFDPAVVDAFLAVVEREGARFIVNSAQVVAMRETSDAPRVVRPFIEVHGCAVS